MNKVPVSSIIIGELIVLKNHILLYHWSVIIPSEISVLERHRVLINS